MKRYLILVCAMLMLATYTTYAGPPISGGGGGGGGDFLANGSVPMTAAIVPNAANTIALGSNAAEWADLFLGDGAIIYGQNDQSATLTSSASTWTASAFATTNALTVGTSLLPDTADGAIIGSATAEWSDIYLADASVIYFGSDQDVTLTHVPDTGLTLNLAMTAASFNTTRVNGTAQAFKAYEDPANGDAYFRIVAPNLTATNDFLWPTGSPAGQVISWATPVANVSTGTWFTPAPLAAPVFTTSAEAPFLILGTAATAAGGGIIRLPNAQYIMAEADIPAADISIIGVDSGEIIQIGASGASGVTITPATTITGILTDDAGFDGPLVVVDGSNTTSYIAMFDDATGTMDPKTDSSLFYNADTGVLTANGYVTTRAASDQYMQLYESTGDADSGYIMLTATGGSGAADSVTWSSSADIDNMSFGSLNLVTTGTIQGGINVITDANAHTITAAEAYGTLGVATGAGQWDLPTAVAGMSFCLADSGTNHDLILDLQAGDDIQLKGTEQANGVGITNAATTTTGDFVCVVAISAGHWMTLGMQGVWASQ